MPQETQIRTTATKEGVLHAVQEMYTGVATGSRDDLHFPVGRPAAEFVGYPKEVLDALPPGAVAGFAGVGYPFMVDAVRPGDTVLDIGSGSGTDLLIAARRTGPEGRAFGLDITDAMMAKTLGHIAEADAHNAFVLRGDAGEAIPLPSESVHTVTTNGVINLIPDKARAFAEALRVLVPGGRLQLADIVVNAAIPESARNDGELWAACIAGADLTSVYLGAIRAAGFVDVEVVRRLDYFAAAPREDSRRTAARFEAEALVVSARKPDA
ncbi:MAG: methyltransferase domain-containing protein [Euryarchaeota archaeon]|nr:methyltransferase domain-containing protein [Euryarchaeota archaeon]